ncbi:MAG: glycosyltransferase family 1 protein [Gammaproteobacteria bacterium]|nr:glycosyltransferase family 1 protein [Gammaproteobacteria bacterium]
MRVLLVHNRYRSGAPGGEDVVFEQERKLLESGGHEVHCYTRSNDEMDERKISDKARVLWQLQRSRRTFRELSRLIRQVRPQIAHFHNVFPLISASGYQACHTEQIPVVQTVHNYRQACATGIHFRAGTVCELCTPGNPWPAVRHGCYRNSRLASLAVAANIFRNHFSGVDEQFVSQYIALTKFSANRLVASGMPREKITVRPNFVEIDSYANKRMLRGQTFVFAGRLSPEKGLLWLLSTWRQLREFRLLVVGDGPLRSELEALCLEWQLPVQFLGLKGRRELIELLQCAAGVIVPSLCFEGGVPLTLLESMGAGTPVVASRIGGIPEFIADGHDGLLVDPGSEVGLAAAVRRIAADRSLPDSMGREARLKVASECGRERSLQTLIDIYSDAIQKFESDPRA